MNTPDHRPRRGATPYRVVDHEEVPDLRRHASERMPVWARVLIGVLTALATIAGGVRGSKEIDLAGLAGFASKRDMEEIARRVGDLERYRQQDSKAINEVSGKTLTVEMVQEAVRKALESRNRKSRKPAEAHE